MTGSCPRNNLDDVLRRRKSNSSTPSSTISAPAVASSAKGSKFKPSTLGSSSFSSSSTVRKTTPLPVFSTPGFGTGSRRIVSPPSSSVTPDTTSEIIDLSNDSPRPSRKRTSDVSDCLPEIPDVVKRTRFSPSDEKENLSVISSIFQACSSKEKGKGKAKYSVPPSPVASLVKKKGKEKEKFDVDMVEKPWMKMESIGDPNPFVRLEEEFPSLIKKEPQKHKDLLENSNEQLERYLSWNQRTLSSYEARIIEYRRLPDLKVDIMTLEGIKTGHPKFKKSSAIQVSEPTISPISVSRHYRLLVNKSKHLTTDDTRIDDEIEDNQLDYASVSDDLYWEAVEGIDMEESFEVEETFEVVEESPSHQQFASNACCDEVMRTLKVVFRLENFSEESTGSDRGRNGWTRCSRLHAYW